MVKTFQTLCFKLNRLTRSIWDFTIFEQFLFLDELILCKGALYFEATLHNPKHMAPKHSCIVPARSNAAQLLWAGIKAVEHLPGACLHITHECKGSYTHLRQRTTSVLILRSFPWLSDHSVTSLHLPSTQEGLFLVVPATFPGKQEHFTVWDLSSILFLLQHLCAAITSHVPPSAKRQTHQAPYEPPVSPCESTFTIIT